MSLASGVLLVTALLAGLLAGLWTSPAQAQRVIRDAEIESTIREYSTPLFQAAGLSPQAVNVYLIQDNSLNAFVTGGLQMFIHTGLLIRSETPNQVIGVLAHETGHITGGHIVGRIQELQNAQAKSLLTYILGIGAAVATGRPEAGTAIIAGGQDAALKGLLSYTRGQEQAADQTAVRLLDATGQSPRGLQEFFEILGGQEVLLTSNQDPYLRTHPLTRDRVNFVEHQVSLSPYADTKDPPDLQERHDRMRAKLIGFLQSPKAVSRAYPQSDSSIPARYARSISLFRQGKLEDSLVIIDEMIVEYPDDPFFHELKGQMLFENARAPEALAPYQTAVELYPNSALLRLALAQVELEVNRPDLNESAVENLEEVLRREPENGFAWRLAATAYNRTGDEGMTALALAERALIRGRFGEAKQRADRAQQLLAEYSPSWLRAQDVGILAENLEAKRKQRNN